MNSYFLGYFGLEKKLNIFKRTGLPKGNTDLDRWSDYLSGWGQWYRYVFCMGRNIAWEYVKWQKMPLLREAPQLEKEDSGEENKHTLAAPLAYIWIMFSAPCFTFNSMLSCFSRPAIRLLLAVDRLKLPGDCGASKKGSIIDINISRMHILKKNHLNFLIESKERVSQV